MTKKKKLPLTLMRYSIVPVMQPDLPAEPLKSMPTSKGEVLSFLAELPAAERRIEHNGGSFLIEPFNRTKDGHRDYLVGRLAKLNLIKVGKLNTTADLPSVILDSTDDWIPICLVVDLNTQYMGAEVSTGKFGDIRATIAIITGIISPFIEKQYGYTVKIEAVTQPQDFWNAIASSQKIYEIKLSLVSPNILDADESAKDAIVKWQRIFNQTEAEFTFKNEQGNLKADRAPAGILARLINYIAGGEGSWKVKSKTKGKSIKTRSSEAVAKKLEVNVEVGQDGQDGKPTDAALVTALARASADASANRQEELPGSKSVKT